MILKCVGGPLDGWMISDDPFDWDKDQRDCIISILHPGTLPRGYISTFQGIDGNGLRWDYHNNNRIEFVAKSSPSKNYTRVLRDIFKKRKYHG